MKMLENTMSHRGYKALACLAAVVVLICAACSTPTGPGSAPGNVIDGNTDDEQKEARPHAEGRNAEIEAAKDTVKRYWLSANSSYEDLYDLFSSSYKEILSTFDGIRNEEEFRKSIPPTERIWPKQTYQSARFYLHRDTPQIRIVVLSDWEENRYTGVMTFIFELVKEGDEWKITDIMF